MRTITTTEWNRLMKVRDKIFAAVEKEMKRKPRDFDRERDAALKVVERETGVVVSVEQFEKIESTALGHFDYLSKLALRLAEFSLGYSNWNR